MNKWLLDRRFTRGTGRFVQASVIATLCSFLLAGKAYAQTIESEWNAETRFYLSGMSFYWAREDASASYDTLAATAELRFKSDARPWYASLFADYRYSTSGDYTDTVNLGGAFRYNWPRWDATTYLFVNKSPGKDDTWLYFGRLRYRLAENHKIGIEALSTFKYPESPQLMLGYYTDISDKLSLTLAAGRGTDNGPDLSARLELVWRVF